MEKTAQSIDDLKKHLKDQFGFLVASAQSYDHGFEAEAKRIAVTIRILVHDTEKSTSLLKLLNVKNSCFLDTSYEYNPKNYLAHTGLVSLQMGSNVVNGYVPFFGDRPDNHSFVSFQRWWKKVVIVDTAKNRFTRSDLVLALANKDGGAHVDPKLDEAYAKLSRSNTIGWKKVTNGEESELDNNVVFPSLRQIAFEVIETLRKIFPDINQ